MTITIGNRTYSQSSWSSLCWLDLGGGTLPEGTALPASLRVV